MFKKLAAGFVFILLLSLFILPKAAFAASLSIQPVDDNNNPVASLNEDSAKAKLTYTDLPANTEFIFCGMWIGFNACGHEVRLETDTSGTATLYVCGDVRGILVPILGLKYEVTSQYRPSHDAVNDCGTGDFFHEHSYSLELSNTKDQKILDSQLNVGPYLPDIKLIAESATPQALTPSDKLKLTITGGRRPYDNTGDRNKYWFQLTRDDNAIPNLQNPSDIDITGVNGSASSEFGPLQAGAYTLKIQPHWADSQSNNITVHFTTDPNGGSISVVTPQLGQGVGECDPAKDTSCGSGMECLPDPIQSKFLCFPIDIASALSAPCKEGLDKNGQQTAIAKDIVKCLTLTTAIGNINTDPASFVKSIFSLVLGISGGVALILIIISGYRLMASQGNPEQVQGAREMLTSAIVGLLFIIFAFVILQIIGVNILCIPGFGTC